MSASADVLLERVRIRAAFGDLPNAERRVRQALERAAWPELGPNEVLIIERLEIKGRARDLPVSAAQATRSLLETARAARGSEVRTPLGVGVVFRDEVELVAALSADLAHGRADGRGTWWAWAASRHQTSLPSLGRLWCEFAGVLPAVVERLAQAGDATLAFAALHSDEAAAVESALAGVRRGLPRALDSGQPPLPPRLLRRYVDALAALPRPGSGDPRLRLAARLALLEARPTADLAAPGSEALRRAVTELVNALRPSVRTGGFGAKDRSAPESPATGEVAARRAMAPAQGTRRDEDPGAPRQDSNRREPGSNAVRDRPGEPIGASRVPAQRDNRAAGFAGVRLRTQFAGALRLINALQHPDLAHALQRCGAERGWAVLASAATALGLLDGDPLAAWLAERVEEAGEPPPPDLGLWIEAARDRFGEALFGYGFIALEGTLEATATHVDVHLALADATLDVRLTGLDVDPGWVPWLARVVRFHYDLDQAQQP